MSSVCIVPVSPLRAEPSHRSEMISQLLFGETVEVLEDKGDFIRVKCSYDGYEGWCQRSQLAALKDGQSWASAGFVKSWSTEVRIDDAQAQIPFGSALADLKNHAGQVGGLKISMQALDLHLPESIKDQVSLLKEFAFMYMGTGYLWGGKSVFGADCSGYTQQVFKMLGIWLPRDSSEQVKIGEPVNFVQESKLGDLAFFDNDEGRIVHVGIMLGGHEIIHASGNVHVDPIDSAGILNKITGIRTHKLRIIKRVLPQ